MALPVNITTITVTGTFIDPQGSPAGGAVTFTPTSTLTDLTGTTIVTGAPVICPLNSSGHFSQVLPCTDNTTLIPNPFMYQVNLAIPYTAQSPFTILLPSTLGPAIDISALAPIPAPATPTAGIYVSQVNGQTGSVTVTEVSGVTITGTPAAGQILKATSPTTATWANP